eukprot:1293457-Pleurochrysis_carterae.AAC.1
MSFFDWLVVIAARLVATSSAFDENSRFVQHAESLVSTMMNLRNLDLWHIAFTFIRDSARQFHAYNSWHLMGYWLDELEQKRLTLCINGGVISMTFKKLKSM